VHPRACVLLSHRMMKFSIGWAVLSLVLFTPLAHANPPSPAAREPIDQSLRERDPRLRLGLAGALVAGVGETSKSTRETSASAGGSADIGIQFGDPYAVYFHGEVGTTGRHAAAYAVGEWAPIQWFSLGAGIGVDWIKSDLPRVYLPNSSAFVPTGTWTGASIPIIAAFNLGGRPAWQARRSVFRIELEAATGIDERLLSGYHFAIALGWTRM
jgi:hypothetical protein